jgi:hypothetical protein
VSKRRLISIKDGTLNYIRNPELARQAFTTITNSYPGYTVEMEQAASSATGRADV